ncbi:MAG: D-aminoacylase [Brevundimonas sp.]
MLFAGATVVDGTGAPGFVADVLVRGDRIAQIGSLGSSGDDVVDAHGLVLAPGFIDMHAHSDLAVLNDHAHLAKISQGVTTEVVGQDGLGYSPVDDELATAVRRQIAGWNGNPSGGEVGWRTVGEYLDRVDAGTATNVAALVPQGNLRALTVGQDDIPPTSAQLDRMRGLLRDGLAGGAVGMSSGLTYTPGMYADTAELEALCEVVAEAGGYYAPHTRSYGAGALAAYAEMLGIARRTGCAVHLTHATLNFAGNRDTAPAFLELVDEALADGVDVSLDTYPYLPGATTLAALLPSWFAAGGPDAMLARLRADDDRDALTHAFEVTGSDGFHGERADWSAIQVSGVENADLRPYVGLTIAQIAAREDRPVLDVVLGLLLDDALATSVLMHVGHEANVQAIMRHRVHSGGSDGILVGDRPHPRAWGTFPRYLARYVRELGVLSLEECVRHLTGTPARRLGLTDRGLVREGFAADLVLFDPASVRDAATFDEPRRPAEGIVCVVVNGQVAMRDGLRTPALAGRALRPLDRNGS